jgi:HK97 family phage portal protein
VAHALSWGNGYAEIERDGAGRAMALWPLLPDRMCLRRDTDGALWYEYILHRGERVHIPKRDVFHLRGLGYDGVCGYSVVRLASLSLGLSKALEQNAATFFGNGSRPDGVLKYPGKITPETREETRREWNKTHAGPSRAHTVAVLDQGLDYSPMMMSNEDAQMVDSRKLSVTDMARWLRVPPHKLYDLERATFSNIEHMSIEFVTDALMPWVNRLEQEANAKMFGQGSSRRLFTKLNVKTLMRGDMETQSNFIQTMLDRGVFSINDARGYLDMNEIGADGDKRLVPLNMQLLEKAGEEPREDGANTNGIPGDDSESDDMPTNNRLNGVVK